MIYTPIDNLIVGNNFPAAYESLLPLDDTVERNTRLVQVLISLRRYADAYKQAVSFAATVLMEDYSNEVRSQAIDSLKDAAQYHDRELFSMLMAAHNEVYGGGVKSVMKAFYFQSAGLDPASTHGAQAATALRQIKSRLHPASGIAEESRFIEFLKGYSSFSVLLNSHDAKNIGGGYFLAAGGYGLVIDPGHHFLDTFLEQHTLKDVNGIVVTHFHDDHYADFTSLLSLLHQQWKSDNHRQIDLYVDATTFEMFQPLITFASPMGSSVVRRRELLAPSSDGWILIRDGVASMRPLPTEHDVLGKNTGVGLAIKFERDNQLLIVTGDTTWSPSIEAVYSHFASHKPILVAHVSTVSANEIAGALAGGALPYYQNHLAVHGLCSAIETLQASVIILSEVGEELASVVHSLATIVGNAYNRPCHVGQFNYKYNF